MLYGEFSNHTFADSKHGFSVVYFPHAFCSLFAGMHHDLDSSDEEQEFYEPSDDDEAPQMAVR